LEVCSGLSLLALFALVSFGSRLGFRVAVSTHLIDLSRETSIGLVLLMTMMARLCSSIAWRLAARAGFSETGVTWKGEGEERWG
jgi:hypothetical protein